MPGVEMKVFDGQVALVTGAAGGIGEAVTRLLADRGSRVMMTDVRVDRGQAIAAEIGDPVACVHLDVSSEDGWTEAVGRTLDAFGRLDILVNNAGVFEAGLLETTTQASFERMIAVNQIGCFLGMKAVADRRCAPLVEDRSSTSLRQRRSPATPACSGTQRRSGQSAG